MRLKLALVTALALSLAALVPAAAEAAKPSPKYYVSLGDSLSVGVQPLASGKSVETQQGYADQLYALKRQSIPGLRLYKLGCGGETTSSMLAIGPKSFCHYTGDRRIGYSKRRRGSQLGAAETFLRRHGRQIAFVSIDIGANDIDSCAKGANVDFTCLNNGIASIKRNIPTISRRLRAAAGRSVPIVGMTLYDPFLELYFNPTTRGLAEASVSLAETVNSAISDAHKRNGIGRVANVFSAFLMTDTTQVTYRGPLTNNRPQWVPRDVERICRLTWMCVPKPQGPNIHANRAGYGVIARTFAPLV